ncbi:uncharacterized protein GGS25DRAFT_486521 [Hypoxylon fragiforme]|uniref:uncharacterized protein n=1 Tax=Hypoxylon fragiforme TaxID=63214 RepID=UPI0020C73AE5|nr:uncharacterized protein GGS25DRAFT_486521 [Hypoxylon fragiforme]KAI2609859.1 hypothetical protein GGS25DRAFT_486521 [Hypoxylon fragiforme]
MPVSLEQAMTWEHLTPTSDSITTRFIMQRCRPWEKVLREYWLRQAHPIIIEVEDFEDDELKARRKQRMGTEFWGFSNLPIELREKIYKILLVKRPVCLPNYSGGDEDFNIRKLLYMKHKHLNVRSLALKHYEFPRYRGVPKDWGVAKTRVPPNALLCAVSKQIQREASHIYFGRNRFVFPSGICNIPAVVEESAEKRVALTGNTFLALRDVSFGFSRHEFWDRTYNNPANVVFYTVSDSHVSSDVDAPLRNMDFKYRMLSMYGTTWLKLVYDPPLVQWFNESHAQQIKILKEAFTALVARFKSMELRRLELNFEDCECPHGCCRLVDFVLHTIATHGKWREHPPRMIDVTGWKDDYEKTRIVAGLQGLSTKEDQVKIRVWEVTEKLKKKLAEKALAEKAARNA